MAGLRPRYAVRLFFLFSFLFLQFSICNFEACGACEESEALKYFKEDRPRAYLASRFYRAGALYVGVVCVMDEAAGLKVYLPLDRELRPGIFKIANEVLAQAGFRSEDDTGQDTVVIWLKG